MRSLQMLAETGILTTRLTLVHRDVVAVDVAAGATAEDKGEDSHVDGQMHKYDIAVYHWSLHTCLQCVIFSSLQAAEKDSSTQTQPTSSPV